jgi:hypothetical protein
MDTLELAVRLQRVAAERWALGHDLRGRIGTGSLLELERDTAALYEAARTFYEFARLEHRMERLLALVPPGALQAHMTRITRVLVHDAAGDGLAPDPDLVAAVQGFRIPGRSAVPNPQENP